ncbi:MAG TPA: Bcr/CflA family multidrug efflux MFS transporter [Azospirillum sp.]|nr:Bcr/CflA family multidrug efflux MFS transporter [Azospirillum sp.]
MLRRMQLYSPQHRPAVDTRWLSVVLSTMMAFGPLSIDMYLPALPEIGRDLAASPASVQMSLSGFFLGFGIGQLVWGPLGDRVGRRGPIAAGIALFVLGSVGCALTGDATHLAMWRFVQAFGSCAAPVLARAMVRDLYPQDQAARMLSLMMLIMSVAPMAAPLVGGQVLAHFGWRAIFYGLAGFGVLAMVALFTVPESLPVSRRSGASIPSMAFGYVRLLGNRRYLAYSLSGAFFFGGMFAYIAGTPFVYIEYFGVAPELYGLLFGLNVVGMMIFNIVNRRLVQTMGSDRVLRAGAVAGAVFGIVLAVVGVTGALGLVGIVVPLFAYLSMTGLIAANAMAGAMSVNPAMAGAASGLAGTLQFGVGALTAAVIGWLADGTPAPMVLVIGGMGIAAALAALAVAPAQSERRT